MSEKKPLKITPSRFEVLKRVYDGDVKISRDGALHPHLDILQGDPMSSRALKAIEEVWRAGLIEFDSVGMFGVYQGKAKLTSDGVWAYVGARPEDPADRVCARCGHEVPTCSKCGKETPSLGGGINRPGQPTRALCHTFAEPDRSKGERTCYEWEAGLS